jgi:myo-inositol catabolism protein IolC
MPILGCQELEEENQKLNRMLADQALDIVALKDVATTKWWSRGPGEWPVAMSKRFMA